MSRYAPQRDIRVESTHLLLFDGDCGLCTSFVQFVLARDPGGIFHFAPLCGPRGRATVAHFGGDIDDPSTMYVVADYRAPHARPLVRSRAALFVLAALGWPWRLLTLAGVLPTVLLDRLYDVIAHNRHRLLGRREQCLMLREEWLGRFIDVPEPISDFAGD